MSESKNFYFRCVDKSRLLERFREKFH